MSATASLPATQGSVPASKGKKKNKKKNKGAAKSEHVTETANTNGVKEEAEAEAEDAEVDEAETPSTSNFTEDVRNGAEKLHSVDDQPAEPDQEPEEPKETNDSPSQVPEPAIAPMPLPNGSNTAGSHEPSQNKFDELVRDRDSLRAEVEQLRKSLEEIQEKHQEEVSNLQAQVEEAQGEKVHAETQYRTLLGRVNTIKSTLGERLKTDAEELAKAKEQIEELEEQNQGLQDRNASLEAELAKLQEEGEERSKELSSLRNRTNLSQQNWIKEREDLLERERIAKQDFEAAKQAMQDWEVLAMEERSLREDLAGRFGELEEQVASYKQGYETVLAERDTQALAVDGLQRALQEIQEARKQELRELVESSQSQVEALRKQLQDMEKRAADSDAALVATKKELERALPFEKEVKEQKLLIGKLRHEAVILNEHLTKALRFLKKGKPEDNVDRQIVTNHFLHFLALDRADPKKFQVLQLIAALLNWNEEQREQAGLARPGTSSSNSLRLPLSPFHRTPSTPAFPNVLSLDTPTGASKESLAELWSDFLEREAQEGSNPGKESRSTSISSAATKQTKSP